MQERNTDFLKF